MGQFHGRFTMLWSETISGRVEQPMIEPMLWLRVQLRLTYLSTGAYMINRTTPRKGSRGVTDTQFDYVVVGAGSGGCVVARRLLDNTDATVLLLEAGGYPDSVASISDPKRWTENSVRNMPGPMLTQPTRTSTVASSTWRGARCSVVRVPLTPRCGRVAAVPTMTAGLKPAMKAGATIRCCRCSSSRRIGKTAQAFFAAPEGRCISNGKRTFRRFRML